jgi:hypothetical protein
MFDAAIRAQQDPVHVALNGARSKSQFCRMSRVGVASPGGPGAPCGPWLPGAPRGPGGPSSPVGPSGPGGPTSPLELVVGRSQLTAVSDRATTVINLTEHMRSSLVGSRALLRFHLPAFLKIETLYLTAAAGRQAQTEFSTAVTPGFSLFAPDADPSVWMAFNFARLPELLGKGERD